ncbi:hypothetical protein DL240_01805 [Lujinxingia litoralis]|uniref:CheR-type methyltransferase domain-containing protein n=1 Tax=Lujinxingia litoralis TaxID=2211119 RepID=A0A328CBM3_9DELT|nr:CheR family methyltransferase [Lujinxingia litoralis]RAL24970.1 hypothetical protein DL240_01805 [Lujinxingia litoralis]
MTQRRFPRREVITQACELFERWTGFALRGAAPTRIADTFARRAEALGYDDPLTYVEALQDLSSTAAEPQRLVNLITNGLTAFWRDEPQLLALRSILRKLGASATRERPLQIWCAGVSTGEEAYTVAMLASEEQVPADILGTDVNTEFLSVARRGQYGSWSLRRLDETRRRTFLRPLNEHTFEVAHPDLQAVRFDHHNLLHTAPRSRRADMRWDVILCRNVLIYFTPRASTTVVGHLADALAHDGYLMLGSSEQIHVEQLNTQGPRLRPTRHGEGFLYRRHETRPGQTIEPGAWTISESTLEELLNPPAPDYDGLDEVTSDVGLNDTVVNLLQDAARHITDGELRLAMACLEAATSYDPFVVEGHCLMGEVLAALDSRRAALKAYQKALFLEPYHWVAAWGAARLHEHFGELEAARRAWRQTLEGLAAHPDPLRFALVLPRLIGPMDDARQQAHEQAHRALSVVSEL